MIYTKKKFKKLWYSEKGIGITLGDMVDCARDWGIPLTSKTHLVTTNNILAAADCKPYFQEG